MKVILTEDVKALGKKGEIVNVSDGYARNFLIPQKKGVQATAGALNDLKLKKANEEKIAKEKKEEAEELSKKLKDMGVTIKARTGAGGKLFGAISSKEIVNAFKEQYGIEVDKKKLLLDEPIKELGTHTIKVKLHRDVSSEIIVHVTEE